MFFIFFFFFFQAEDGIRDADVTGVQTCALPIFGIHRCIGSNVARTVFKRMVVQVLDRMPDYTCYPAGAVHYDTVGVINGMRQLPATFTPGRRLGAGLDETIDAMQRLVDEQRLADPVTRRSGGTDDQMD